MIDDNKEFYQSPATKEDIERLDDKLEHITSSLTYLNIGLHNLNAKADKLVAWTQRAGRMSREFLDHFPNLTKDGEM